MHPSATGYGSPADTAAGDRYLLDRVLTASPAELTNMLFDAAVASLRAAIRHQEAGQWLDALPKLLRAQNIVLELRSALSPAGGELTGNLDQLYLWCYRLLLRANSERCVVATREALAVLEPLQLGWREMRLADHTGYDPTQAQPA